MPPDPRPSIGAILAGDRCVFPASVHDPISARIAADLGFALGVLGGSVASLAVLGDPDLALITLTEFADLARRICRASPLPVMADADHGYGNALNVRRTVIELEAAGLAGITIEDTDLPRRHGVSGEPGAIPIGEACDKIAAALDARRNPEFAIIARTSLKFEGGLDACLARVAALSRMGADAVFVGGVSERAELDAIAARATTPLVLGAARPATDDAAYLAARGVRICLRGHKPFQQAVRAAYRTLLEQRDGAAAAEPPGAAALVERYSRAEAFDALERRFLARP